MTLYVVGVDDLLHPNKEGSEIMFNSLKRDANYLFDFEINEEMNSKKFLVGNCFIEVENGLIKDSNCPEVFE